MIANYSLDTMVKGITTIEMQTISEFYKVWEHKQYDVLDTICVTNWKDIPLAPNQEDSLEGFKKIIEGFTQKFPDLKINILDVFGTNERIAVRAEMSFTLQSELFGIPATQERVIVRIHDFHYLQHGQLTHTWHLEDWFGLLMQSGGFTSKNNLIK
ncbi:ester cyclase [Flavobacterium sp. J27]|uniref:ester cyclase n=1 Tax=Flavobacterium sp. J27 TaxID=2060419 RepID=UPI0010325C0C|nr:ester cyclase [Flavobacterium sp. J27]